MAISNYKSFNKKNPKWNEPYNSKGNKDEFPINVTPPKPELLKWLEKRVLFKFLVFCCWCLYKIRFIFFSVVAYFLFYALIFILAQLDYSLVYKGILSWLNTLVSPEKVEEWAQKNAVKIFDPSLSEGNIPMIELMIGEEKCAELYEKWERRDVEKYFLQNSTIIHTQTYLSKVAEEIHFSFIEVFSMFYFFDVAAILEIAELDGGDTVSSTSEVIKVSDNKNFFKNFSSVDLSTLYGLCFDTTLFAEIVKSTQKFFINFFGGWFALLPISIRYVEVCAAIWIGFLFLSVVAGVVFDYLFYTNQIVKRYWPMQTKEFSDYVTKQRIYVFEKFFEKFDYLLKLYKPSRPKFFFSQKKNFWSRFFR